MDKIPFEAVIGLETHAELLTQSKMFCGCAVAAAGAGEPNSRVCPICAGLPGTLPVLNAGAVEAAVRVALALNGTVAERSVFARKNYFYPDLPKGFQISQYELPLSTGGWLDVATSAGAERIRLRRVHLEEDTGKLLHPAHAGTPAPGPDRSLVDLNRAGVPLLEIVTEPDLRSAEAARAFAEQLRAVLRALGVSSGDMEQGVLRFEPNVSVRPVGSAELRARVELKNLNSFRALERGIAYEVARQAAAWESGEGVVQETRGWSEAEGRTLPQRRKEHAQDYRYFPEPDLPPLVLDPAWVEQMRASLPELPAARQARLAAAHGLAPAEAARLAADPALADYFERAVAAAPALPPTVVAHWVTAEVARVERATGRSLAQMPIPPENLAALALLVAEETLNTGTARAVLDQMAETGRAPAELVAQGNLAQLSDAAAITRIVEAVIAENPKELAIYLAGKTTLEQWFVGQVARRLQGRGNPQLIRQAVAAALARQKPV